MRSFLSVAFSGNLLLPEAAGALAGGSLLLAGLLCSGMIMFALVPPVVSWAKEQVAIANATMSRRKDFMVNIYVSYQNSMPEIQHQPLPFKIVPSYLRCMQHRINPDMDIISYILEAVLKERPDDSFCKSIQEQYAVRGGLSKKQLEGLQGKALRVPGIHPGRLATLEAIIKKKHVTHRSVVTTVNIPQEKDAVAGEMITAILLKYPQHKRVLLFKIIFDKEGKLAPADREELVKFNKILAKITK